MFIHLHNHTEYSLLDGMSRIEELVLKVKELGQTAIAITDHGSLHGVIDFYNTCKKHGIKPIIGCEVYIVPDRLEKDGKVLKRDGISNSHLVLIAINDTGYKNLLNIVTDAHVQGFRHRPRTDHSVLAKHNEGIIALSACMEGEIPRLILQDKLDEAKAMIQKYKDTFGERFYLEIQPNSLDQQKIINKHLISLSKETNTPLVATCDTHYINQEDSATQDVLLAMSTGKSLTDENRLSFKATEFYIQSEEELRKVITEESAIENTAKIADMVDLEIETMGDLLPHIEVPEGYTEDTYLAKLCYEGLYKLIRQYPELDTEKYEARLKYELEVIKDKGRSGYLLIVWDFVAYARNNGIPVGPGRGSAAGSIVSYLLDITAIDPIKYNLLFERFLNPERMEMPDIDIDFCYNNRHRVIEYVAQKYGTDRVANVMTFGTLTARSCLDGVAITLDIDFKTRKEITKTVPEIPKITIAEALELSPELRKYKEQYKDLFAFAERIEGRKRHGSTHACGVVITPRALTEFTALRLTQGSKGDLVTHLDMDTLAEVGLAKFDFLGLKTITAIYDTMRIANIDIDIDHIPLDNPATFKLLNSGKLDGIFQFEKPWAANLLRELHPTKFEHIIDAGALLRPGPMDSGATREYINCKKGIQPVEYEHEDLKPILEDTYGVLVYQEQVIQIAQALAGYTAGQGDSFRKAVGKKIKELIDEQLKIFKDWAMKRGYDEEFIMGMADKISKHARYGFNKSHAATYGLITYQTAYLKAHYPVEYMAALMTSEMDRPEKVLQYLSECRRLGIKILPPDINKSGIGFTVEDGAIRYALSSIKFLADKAAKEIIAHQPYKDLEDLYDRIDRRILNKTSMRAVVNAGAFDSINPNRKEVMRDYYKLRSVQYKDIDDEGNVIVPDEMDTNFTQADAAKMEQEYLSICLSAHPLNDYVHDGWYNIADGEELTTTGTITRITPYLTKSGYSMHFADMDTIDGNITLMLYTKVLDKHVNMLKEGKTVTTIGIKSGDKIKVDKVLRPKKKKVAE